MVHLVSFWGIFLSGHITSELLFLDQMYLFIKSVEAQGPWAKEIAWKLLVGSKVVKEN